MLDNRVLALTEPDSQVFNQALLKNITNACVLMSKQAFL
ncbi:hypothetical protein GXM_02984 [Nostoc sphaeroides CCNUC1]|uniref:Uncharacterized protein n=1 Tax=Nostoc sphaeroides CCNUC1 TaxID=2653204 RepID=A0A5P8VYP3_9NOSO|nr:hypothetical protein GXM_02984 [Nostoc sphaeroides CCNUC1]